MAGKYTLFQRFLTFIVDMLSLILYDYLFFPLPLFPTYAYRCRYQSSAKWHNKSDNRPGSKVLKYVYVLVPTYAHTESEGPGPGWT